MGSKPTTLTYRPTSYDRAYYEKNAEARKQHVRKSIGKHAHKEAARRILKSAIRRGEVIPQPCMVCGAIRVDGHHPDYAYPLVVLWLCRLHHKRLHLKKSA